MIKIEEGRIEQSDKQVEDAKAKLIDSMKELSILRIYKILEQNDREKAPNKKDEKEMIAFIEKMLEQEKNNVNVEARCKKELLTTEK
jgi:hypothetical protein